MNIAIVIAVMQNAAASRRTDSIIAIIRLTFFITIFLSGLLY